MPKNPPSSNPLLSAVSAWPASSGRDRYAEFLRGASLGRAAAMLAKCAECCHGYADGRRDCRMPACPLYPWMPYREG